MEAPEFLNGGIVRAGNPQFGQEKRHTDSKPADHFIVEDLLDFSNEEEEEEEEEAAFPNDDDGALDASAGNSTDSSTVTAVESACNSSFSGSDNHFSGDRASEIVTDAHFSGELCVPVNAAETATPHFPGSFYLCSPIQITCILRNVVL